MRRSAGGSASDPELIAETIATERDCCPFSTLEWEPDSRRLTVSVTDAEQQPALHAIALALGIADGDSSNP